MKNLFNVFEDWCMKKYGSQSNSWAGGNCIDKRFKLFNRKICISWRDRKGLGRFGAGWNIKLGFQLGGSTIIFNLLFFQIRINRKSDEVYKNKCL